MENPSRIVIEVAAGAAIAPSLGGDLATIVGCALQKDRDRRYQSAHGLRRDIQRYLSGDAISAHAPTLGYQLRVLVRRNQIWISAAAIVLLLGPLGDRGAAADSSADVVWLVPELDSLETTELLLVLDSFDPAAPASVMVVPFIDDLGHQELERVLQAWEG